MSRTNLLLKLAEEVLPPLRFFLTKRRWAWYRLLDDGGAHRRLRETARAHAAAIKRYTEAAVLAQFVARLANEHARLDVVENKARAIFGLGGAAVSVVGLVGPLLDRPQSSSAWFVAGGIAALIYFGTATLLAIRANEMGIRYYVDPGDLDEVRTYLDPEDARSEAKVLSVTCLTFKDFMVDATDDKGALVSTALMTFRNGVICVGLALAARFWGR